MFIMFKNTGMKYSAVTYTLLVALIYFIIKPF